MNSQKQSVLANFPVISGNSLENEDIDNLLNQFSSPLYIFSARCIKQKFDLLKTFLVGKNVNYSIAYAFKTNSVETIISYLKGLGLKAEVASPFEYSLAVNLGFKGKQITVNGPFKPNDLLREILKNGNRMNIDNFEELTRIADLAKDMKKRIALGLRLKISENSRFGLSKKVLNKAFSLIKREERLFCHGFHFHYGTNSSKDDYVRSRLNFIKLVSNLKVKYDLDIGYINIGGSLPVEEDFGINSISLDGYLNRVIKQTKSKLGGNIEIIFEPGRFLVDQAGVLVSRVFSVENWGQSQRVLVDASWGNLLPAPYRNHEKQLLKVLTKKKYDRQTVMTEIYGASCREDDMFYKGKLPKLNGGDKIVFFNVGAYAISLSSQFMFPKPAVIILNEDAKKLFKV